MSLEGKLEYAFRFSDEDKHVLRKHDIPAEVANQYAETFDGIDINFLNREGISAKYANLSPDLGIFEICRCFYRLGRFEAIVDGENFCVGHQQAGVIRFGKIMYLQIVQQIKDGLLSISDFVADSAYCLNRQVNKFLDEVAVSRISPGFKISVK